MKTEVQDNHYFERYDSSLTALLAETNLDYASTVLQELAVEIKRSRKVSKDEKQELVNKLTQVSETIQKRVDKLTYDDSGEIDYDEFEIEGDHISSPSWRELNPDGLSYPIWLNEVCLPSFFPLAEPELQNPIAVCIALMNSNALPPKSKAMSLEAELPVVLFVGKSGSGKSTFAEWIGHHYTGNAYYEILGSSSPKLFRDICDRACNRGHGKPESELFGKLRSAYVLVDNFEASYFTKWESQKEIFLAVRRSQSVHGTSAAGAKKISQTVYYTHCLKILTTLDNPGKVTAQQPDMARRLLPIFFERKGTGLGGYSFEGLTEEYRKVWNRSDVKKRFFPLLGKFLSKDHEKSPISGDYYSKSVTLLAVGCYLGLWDSEEEAEEHLSAFWKFVDERSKDSTSDALLISLDEYLDKHNRKASRMRKGAFGDLPEEAISDIDARKLYDSIYDAILSTGVQRSRGKDFEKDVSNLMRSKGYSLKRISGKFVFSKL